MLHIFTSKIFSEHLKDNYNNHFCISFLFDIQENAQLKELNYGDLGEWLLKCMNV